MKILISFLLFISLYAQKPLKICDDMGEWAPYTYFKRVNGKIDKTKIIGIMPDVLNEISKQTGLKYSIDMIPWSRCVNMVKNYDKTHKYEAFMDGSYTTKRAKEFLVSLPIYATHQTIFYSSKKFPNGVVKNSKFDINNYKICDVHGYTIEHYYKEMGLRKDKKIDQRAKDYTAVFKKISSGRCDITVASGGPIYGMAIIGKIKIPKDIKSQPFPNMKQSTFHIFISKKSPRAKELLKQINDSIKKIKSDGTFQKIEDKYLKNK